VLNCDKTFLGDYDFAPCDVPGGPSNGMFWYPGASRVSGRDGAVLSIEPRSAAPWIGRFASSFARGASCAVALPDGKNLAVVSKGAAYRVAAHDPLDWNEIPTGAASEPVVMEALELVLFVDNTVVSAYGRDGLAWQTERLVWDQLMVGRVDGSTLEAEGFDAPADRIVSFTINLRTGEAMDAPYPPRSA
jgi:hypothetical protein